MDSRLQHHHHHTDSQERVTSSESDVLQDSPKSDESFSPTFYDVLPSFEMHNYLFNRSVKYNKKNQMSFQLPSYSEYNNTHSSSSSHEMNAEHEHAFTGPYPIEQPHLLLMNNLDKVEPLCTPLKISIELTAAPPQRGQPTKPANPLKEYKSGDYITGVVRVSNPTNQEIPFEMVLISLEGQITIPQEPTSSTSKMKLKRLTFLKSFDIGACFTESHVFPDDLSSHHKWCSYDEYDQTYYGFPDTKKFGAGKNYKKFFTFKLPETLLDDFCEHSYFTHFKELPPSFGNDIEASNGDAEFIQFNDSLGYGRLPTPGSQIVTKDYSSKGESVQYSINCRLLALKDDSNNEEDITDDFKEPTTTSFVMIKDLKHYFRFVPIPLERLQNDIGLAKIADSRRLHPLSTSKQFQSYELLLDSKLMELQERIKFQNAGITDEDEIQRMLNDTLSETKKRQQLILKGDSSSLEDKTELQKFLDLQDNYDPEFNYYETELKLTKKGTILKSKEDGGTLIVKCKIPRHRSLKYIVPAGLAKLSGADLDEGIKQKSTSSFSTSNSTLNNSSILGDSQSQFTRPGNSRRGSSSSRLSKLSKGAPSSRSTKSSREASIAESSSSSVATSLSASKEAPPYTPSAAFKNPIQSIKSKDVSWLNHIDVELIYLPPESSAQSVRPPELTDSRQFLSALTLSTTQPMPVTVDADFFTDLRGASSARHLLSSIKLRIAEKFNNLKKLSKEANCSVSKALFYDLLSIVNMRMAEQTIPLFKPNKYSATDFNWKAIQIPKTLSDSSSLSKSQSSENLSSTQKIAWKTNLSIKLETQTDKLRSLAVVPNFENCYVSRFYGVRLDLGFKKHNYANTLIIPVRVAKP